MSKEDNKINNNLGKQTKDVETKGSSKNFGLFFISKKYDEPIFYKAYTNLEELYYAIEHDDELYDYINNKDLEVTNIQVVTMIKEK